MSMQNARNAARSLVWVGALTAVVISSLGAQETCEWQLERTTTIGSIDGPDALSPILDLTVGPDGHVYVAQQFVPHVAVFDRDGRLVRTIGRAGQGPGEFDGNPVRLGWVGDTLWVADFSKTTLFSEGDEPIDRAEFSTLFVEEGSVFVPGVLLINGSYLAKRSLRGREMLDFARADELPLRRFTDAGEVADTLAVVPKNPQVFRGEGFSVHPLWPWEGVSWLPVASAPDGSSVAFTRADGTWFDLIEVGVQGDTLLHRRIQYDPRPLEDEHEDWLRTVYSGFVAGDYTPESSSSVLTRDNAARERDRREARDALTVPEVFPPVREIVLGSDGSIWVLRELRLPELTDRWEVYSPDGIQEGSVVISEGRGGFVPWAPRLTVLHANRNEVWGTTLDDLDVPYIHRYRVVDPCS